MKKQFLLFLAICFTQSIFAQTITNYTTTDGLISDNVNCIDIDANNNIWMGTQMGISKFDGTTWTSYNQSSHPGLVNNNVTAIFVASNGDVWAGTDYGVSVLSGGAFTTYTTTNGLGNNRINDIAQDMNGNIWIGDFSGLSKYNNNGTFTAYGTGAGLPFGGITHISVDASNNLWMGSGLGGVVKYDAVNFTITNTSNGLLHNVVRSVEVDAQGNKWVGTASGVSVINNSGQVVNNHTRMYIIPAPDTLNPVEDLAIDGAGRVWVGVYVDYLVTVGGVAMYNGSQWLDYDDVNDGLVGPVIRQLEIDDNDNVWIATSTGVTKIANAPNAISKLETKNANFQLFPNPATDYLTIQFSENIQDNTQATIYSTSLQELGNFAIDGGGSTVQLPLENLNNGLYFVKIGNLMGKFLVNK